jgi:hypothetical protein
MSTFFWFTSETVIAPSFSFAQYLGGGVTSWWTWSVDDFRVNRTDSVFFDTIVNSAIMFPWFTTWQVSIAQMFTFTWWVSASVGFTTESWLSWDSVNNSVGSTAEFDS